MSWDNDRCLLLISNYRNRSILWDSRHPQHYNKILKNDAWTELASELDCSIDECRKKMTSLLASLRREKTKHEKSIGTGKGADETYRSSWFAYESLKFIFDKNKPREVSDTTDNTSQSTSEGLACERESSSQGLQSSSQLELTEEQVSQRESSNSKRQAQRERNKRRRETDDDTMMRSAFETLQKSTNSINTMNDEFGTYGMFVANKLRKYTENTKNHVQHMISNILYSADKGEFDYYNTNMYGGSRGYCTAHSTPSDASTSAHNPNQLQNSNTSDGGLDTTDVMSQLSEFINSP